MTTAQPAIPQQSAKPTTAKDNLLGICNALGNDFGFNPLWLRLALGAAFVVQPLGVVISYLALGAIVLISRLAIPAKRAPAPPVITAQPDSVVANEPEQPEFAKAA